MSFVNIYGNVVAKSDTASKRSLICVRVCRSPDVYGCPKHGSVCALPDSVYFRSAVSFTVDYALLLFFALRMALLTCGGKV